MQLELNGIDVLCIIGELPAERVTPQRLEVSLKLTIPADAAETDAIEDTVDYVEVAEAVRQALVKGECRLIERAAALAAQAAMADPRVRACEATVEKAGVVPGLGAAVARFTLSRDGE